MHSHFDSMKDYRKKYDKTIKVPYMTEAQKNAAEADADRKEASRKNKEKNKKTDDAETASKNCFLKGSPNANIQMLLTFVRKFQLFPDKNPFFTVLSVNSSFSRTKIPFLPFHP